MTGRSGGMLKIFRRAGFGGASSDPFSHFPDNGGVGAGKSRKKAQSYKKESNSSNTTLNLSASSNGGVSDKSGNYRSGAFSSLICLPLSAASGAANPSWSGCSSPTCSDDSEWEYAGGSEDEVARGFYEDFVFGTVPSRDEVQHAVSSLQQILGPSSACFPFPKSVEDEFTNPVGFESGISTSNAEMDWVEPSAYISSYRISQPIFGGSDQVYDAFNLLQTEPSVQRMVLSLSSDESVWNAVLNNDVVKELRSSISQASLVEDKRSESSDEKSTRDSDDLDTLRWVFAHLHAKITQLINRIAMLLNGVFLPKDVESEGFTGSFEEKLKNSLFLSIIVLLIVVVTRVRSA